MEVIAINNQKGGVLKTTITTHLACVLALEGNKVLIVDADSQSNVALSFNVNADKLKYTLYDVLVNDIPAADAIVNVYWKGDSQIDVLPSNNLLAMFIDDVKVNKKEQVLKAKLEHLRNEYDYILIDTPPTLSNIVENVFMFADKVIIPFQPEQYSRRSLNNVLNKIKSYKMENEKLEVLGVVATIVESNTNLHKDVIEQTNQLCEKMNVKMLKTVIPKSIRYASSIGYDGRPIILTQPNNKLSTLYKTIWSELND